MNQRSSNRSELRPLTSQERPNFDDSFYAQSTVASSSHNGKASSKLAGSQLSQPNVLLKRRHGRLHKMGIINLDQRMKGPAVSESQRGSPYPSEAEAFDETTPMVSKSLTSLTPTGLPPLNLRPGNFTPERRSSPKNSNRPSSSRPGTAVGFGSGTDRNLLTDLTTGSEKHLSMEEIQQLEEMMNPNRPRTSSVRVQIKRYMSDVETLERNAKLSYAHASTHALKANFAYTGSLDELQDVFAKEAKSFDSVALFAQTRYLEMVSYEGADREPTKFKAALCADLLAKLTSTNSRNGRVMDPLLWELCNCIFVDYEKIEHRFKHDRNNLMLKELVRAPTYLELAHQLHDRLEEMTVEAEIASRGMQMKNLVKKFQTLRLAFQQSDIFLRDACFTLWKGYFRRHQHQYRLARLKGLRYRFRQWRHFASQGQAMTRKGEEFSDQLDAKIHRLMTLNQNLLQISEQQVDSQKNNLGKLTKEPTRRNIADDLSPQMISNLLASGASSDPEGNLPTPLGITPRLPSGHLLTTATANAAAGGMLPDGDGHASSGGGHYDPAQHRPLSPDSKRVQFFMPKGRPLEPEAAEGYDRDAIPPGFESPDVSRPPTADVLKIHHSSNENSRPDTPELMEYNHKQATAGAQQHNIPAHLLGRPPPNAARAILRHRAAVVGTASRLGTSSRRNRVPQQDASVQANAEDFDTIDINNHRIMLPKTTTVTLKGGRLKTDVTPDSDDFDHNQYMVIILSPRDQHETHVGNVTTHPLLNMTQRMKALQPHASPALDKSLMGPSQKALQRGVSSPLTTTAAATSTSTAATVALTPPPPMVAHNRHGSIVSVSTANVTPESAQIYLSTTLSMDMVIHLIGAVYESLFCHYFYDPRAASEEVASVLFLARDVIYRRYHYDRSLGKTIFKEFVRGCLEYVGLSKRIEVFCNLSGLITSDIDDLETGTNLSALTDEAASINKIKLTADNIKNMNLQEKLQFFVLTVSLWSNNIPLVAVNMLLTAMVDRDVVLHHLSVLFPSLEKQNRIYNTLVTTIIEMPCYHADALRNNHFAEADTLDLDVVCDIFLRYEQPERTARLELQKFITDSNDEMDGAYDDYE